MKNEIDLMSLVVLAIQDHTSTQGRKKGNHNPDESAQLDESDMSLLQSLELKLNLSHCMLFQKASNYPIATRYQHRMSSSIIEIFD